MSQTTYSPIPSTSDSSSDVEVLEQSNSCITPTKKRYRKAIRFGLNKRQTLYHDLEQANQNACVDELIAPGDQEPHSTTYCPIPSTSDSSSDVEVLEQSNSFITPRKKRYRKAIHLGLNKRQTLYHISEQANQNACVDELIHVAGDQEPDSSEIDLDTTFSSSCSSNELSSDSDLFDRDIDGESSESSVESDSRQGPTACDYLYEGCRHTYLTSYMSAMLYVQKHSVSKEGFSDLLRFIATHLPVSCKYSMSIYKVKDFLNKHTDFKDPTVHKFCERCSQLLPSDSEVCLSEECRNSSAKVQEIHDLNVEDQLRDLCQDDSFITTVKECNADTGHGSEYQRLKELQTEDNRTVNLTLTMNTDGVTLFSSSKKGNLWPIYVAINELPIKQRFSRKCILTTHLYCHSEKPNMLTYMAPLVNSLKTLSETGLVVMTPRGRMLITAHLQAATVDLPARAMVANMKQFNGKFGCSVCLDEGAARPNAPMLRYWPFQPDSALRTHDAWMEDAEQAVLSNKAVNGIKGASPLLSLRYIDLPKVFALDWMHCVLLGVTKTLMKLWFDSSFKMKQFHIGDKITLLNHRLLQIQVPDFVSRRPRNLEECQHWKATECREWLLHFSIPVLEGVLPSEHHLHYSLLVTAMYLLNEEHIQDDNILYAEKLLVDFCRLFPNLYGEFRQTMNIHLLKHLPHFVRLHGPLFVTSCFGFESMNNHLKSMVHGTRFINKQVAYAVGITRALPRLMKQWSEGDIDVEVHLLIKHLSSKFICEETPVGSQESMLGKKTNPTVEEQRQIRTMLDADDHDLGESVMYKFLRLARGSEILYSRQYKRAKTRNSYTVSLESGGLGEILYFIMINAHYFAVVQPLVDTGVSCVTVNEDMDMEPADLRTFRNYLLCPHITKVQASRGCVLVDSTSISKKCVSMKFSNNTMCVSVPPNLLEHN